MATLDIVALASIVGVAQAVIGMVRKFGLRGNALLATSAIITTVLVLLTTYAWDYEPLRLVVVSVMGTLTAAGYWRYRNGEQEVVVASPEDDVA
jgi:uncharacterized membrane protein YccC